MSAPDEADLALLKRYVGGDVDAFIGFYRRHLPTMLSFFLRRTRDPEVTADLTAEVFAAALIAARGYRPEAGRPVAWLYGIAAHKLADSRRRGRVESEARRRLALEPLPLEDADLDRIGRIASEAEAEARVQEAVQALPRRQRDAVLAHVVDERGYRELAAQMGCSELVVRQRVSRGLRALRSLMKE